MSQKQPDRAAEQHTPRKLEIHDGGRFGQFADSGPSICAVRDDSTCQPLLEFVGPADPRECEANGRRIVAAWNAAHDAGLTTAALEAGVVKALAEATAELLAVIRDTGNETSMRFIGIVSDSRTFKALDAANAALALTKGA